MIFATVKYSAKIHVYMKRERKSKCGEVLTVEQLINLDGAYRSVSCNSL